MNPVAVGEAGSTVRPPNRPPVLVDRVLDDRDVARQLVERHAPYAPVQRYVANAAESAAIGDPKSGRESDEAPPIVASVFRGDWATPTWRVDGAEAFMFNERLLDAARRLFDRELVRPVLVYANLTWQLPFAQGPGHRDVPEFRGFSRERYPIWLLLKMRDSELFADYQVDIATAVAWYWTRADGGLEYWPDGGHAPSAVHEGDIDNTAIMGDNDRMWHRVRPVGDPADGMLGDLTLDTRLVHHGDGEWAIEQPDGRRLAEMRTGDIRVSISWKALVFADGDEERRYDDHLDDLAYDEVRRRFEADLVGRGIPRPEGDLLANPAWARLLADTYPDAPH